MRQPATGRSASARRGRRGLSALGWVCFGVVVTACAGASLPKDAPTPAASVIPMPELPPAPLCTVLQPKFDRLSARFGLGGRLDCEEVPGIVSLGQFGSALTLDRRLEACVDDARRLTEWVQVEPAALDGLSYETNLQSDSQGVLGLGAIAPWLPDVRAGLASRQRIAVRLAVTDAAWETLTGLTPLLERQAHSSQCLATLCREETLVAYKVLRGRVRVSLTLSQGTSERARLELLENTAGFAIEQRQSSSRELTLESPERLVLGVVTKRTAPELHEGSACDRCGAQDQSCCAAGQSCDAGLSCVSEVCRAPGFPDAPCREGHCVGGSVCVRGTCRVDCGHPGAPCCGEACGEGVVCSSGQRARREVTVLDQVAVLGRSLFGKTTAAEYGSGSCGPGRLRSRFATLVVDGEGASCAQVEWIAPRDPSDCRIRVQQRVAALGQLQCRVQIFATEEDPSSPAPRALCR